MEVNHPLLDRGHTIVSWMGDTPSSPGWGLPHPVMVRALFGRDLRPVEVLWDGDGVPLPLRKVIGKIEVLWHGNGVNPPPPPHQEGYVTSGSIMGEMMEVKNFTGISWFKVVFSRAKPVDIRPLSWSWAVILSYFDPNVVPLSQGS